MIDGITVLNTINNPLVFEFIVGVLFGLALLVFGFIELKLVRKENTKNYATGAIMLCAGIFIILVACLISFSSLPSYEVLIDDSVSFMDFYERYRIMGQRGDIFTIVVK